jgi:hypothetical protein
MDIRLVVGLLPFLSLLLAAWVLAPWLGKGSLRRGVLRAGILWATYSILSLELLSLFSLVNVLALVLIWAVPALILMVFLILKPSGMGSQIRGTWSGMGGAEKILLSLLAAVALVSAIVAFFAPPTTWDSLNYHMPRVAHWAQLMSVRHYPTGIEIQNSMTPGAEMLVLHSYVLGGSDRWANFVQWFAMLGSLVGVTQIAKQLGVPRLGQLGSAIFVATLPVGIIQASSTMTDYVVAVFLVATAIETLTLARNGQIGWMNRIALGLAASLAILTKPTAYAYVIPFALYSGYVILRRERFASAARWGSIALLLILSLNSGHYFRNYTTYGNPVSKPSRIDLFRSPWLGGRAFLSNLIRNAAMHAGTPSPHLNKAVALIVQEAHELLGLDVSDPRTTAVGIFKVRWSSTNEDKATNPVHAALAVGGLIVATSRRDRWTRDDLVYAGLTFGTFLAFSLVLKWQLFAGRYHLPFFVLMGPLVSRVASESLRPRAIVVFSILLVLSVWPWLLQIKSRPLILVTGDTYVGSILDTPRDSLYFANGPYLERPYTSIAAAIGESGCQSVRLRLEGNSAEYPLWALLGAPRSGIQIGWAISGAAASGALQEELPESCAVLCEHCTDEGPRYGELFEKLRMGPYQLYLPGP